jgi:hypothetical protein
MIFKKLGLYDEDYHEKYRKYIREKRYVEYINKVIEDIQNKIRDKNKEQIKKLIKEKFPEPPYIIHY